MEVELSNPSQETANDFTRAARERWQCLAEELRSDVREFNFQQGHAGFANIATNQFLVSNSRTGLELIITADFEERIIRYAYEQLNDKTKGVPDGGILSMREAAPGAVEFYSADEQLTSEETRKVLLEAVLFPPEIAA